MRRATLSTMLAITALLGLSTGALAETPVSGASTSWGPDAAAHNNQLALAYTTGTSIAYRFGDMNGTFGTAFTVPGATGITRGPGIESFNGSLYVFFIVNNFVAGNKQIRYQVLNSSGSWLATPASLPNGLTDTEVGLTVFSNRLYATWRVSGGNIFWAYLTTNGIWTVPQQVPNSQTSSDPEFAVFNGQLYLIYAGDSGSLKPLFYRTLDAAGNFGPQIQVPGSPTPRLANGPGAAEFNFRLYTVYRGSSSDSVIYKTLDTSGFWTPEFSYGSSRTSASPAAVTFANKLWIFYKGLSSTSLYYKQVL
jgi:hypothetical protein